MSAGSLPMDRLTNGWLQLKTNGNPILYKLLYKLSLKFALPFYHFNLDLNNASVPIDYLADGWLPLKTIAIPSSPMNISQI